MTRFLSALAAVVGSTALSLAAPPSKPEPAALYSLTNVGDTWALEGEGSEITSVVTASEWKDGEVLVSVKRSIRGKGQDKTTDEYTFKVSVSERGVAALELGGRPLDTPDWSIRLPADATKPWTGLFGEERTAGKPEKVTVPGGTFTAIPVRGVKKLPDGRVQTVTEWYAPGVGLVRSMWQVGGEKAVYELTKFRLGPRATPPATK